MDAVHLTPVVQAPRGTDERLAAVFTRIRKLACMDAFMRFDILLELETFTAVRADMGSQVAVGDGQVSLQGDEVVKLLRTLVASQVLLIRALVQLQVDAQGILGSERVTARYAQVAHPPAGVVNTAVGL